MQATQMNYEIVLTLREKFDQSLVTPVDDEEIIIGLKAMGIEPVALLRYDRFLALWFVESEFTPEPFLSIQKATSGEGPGPLIPYQKIVLARRWWKSMLSTYKRNK